jgi:hypothetical protein
VPDLAWFVHPTCVYLSHMPGLGRYGIAAERHLASWQPVRMINSHPCPSIYAGHPPLLVGRLQVGNDLAVGLSSYGAA